MSTHTHLTCTSTVRQSWPLTQLGRVSLDW
jgi:hypothetical protein